MYNFSIVALIGLGLVFWGVILTYVQSSEYVKKTVLDSTTTTLLTALNETLETLGYKGKAIYLPPKYVTDPDSTKVYVPKLESGTLPASDAIRELETTTSHRNTQGLLITPPGTELAKLIETTIGTSFLRMNLADLRQCLPKTLVEDLEVVTSIEIRETPIKETGTSTDGVRPETSEDEFSVRFTTVAFKAVCERAAQLPLINASVGCPLSSAIAIALTKVTGRPSTIKSQHTSEDGHSNETQYLILKEETP